jgi:hypothetical protein
MKRWLKKADLVFVDYPSTPMWEAMDCGLPVLCVTPMWDVHEIRNHLFSEICLYCVEPDNDYRELVFGLINSWLANTVVKSIAEGIKCPV